MYSQIKLALYAILLAGFASPVFSQVPPPPPSNDVALLEKNIVRAVESKDITLYSSILSDRVYVFQDGIQIASDKQTWLKKMHDLFLVPGVRYSIVSAYRSPGHFLTIEYFNSINSWPGNTPARCCWGFRAVSYSIQGDHVSAIYSLSGGPENIIRTAR